MGYMTKKFNNLCKIYNLNPNIHMEHMDVKVYGIKDHFSQCSIQGGDSFSMTIDKKEHINVTRCVSEFAKFSLSCLELDKMDKE